MKKGDIIFIHYKGFLPNLIQKVTRCKYNHVGIFINKEEIIEATFKGVVKSNITKFENTIYEIKRVKNIQSIQINVVLDFIKSQLGTNYDFLQLICVFFYILLNLYKKEPIDIRNFWLCSELLAEAFEIVGIKFADKDSDNITPADIYYSDKLKELSPTNNER